MSASIETFDMPREQYPSWAYWKVFARAEAKSKKLSFFWARNGIFYSLQALGISRMSSSPPTSAQLLSSLSLRMVPK